MTVRVRLWKFWKSRRQGNVPRGDWKDGFNKKGTAVKRKYSGMTLIEILMVAGIIVVIAGLLIPATTLVRKVAKETKQRAELGTIELAITTFKNDYGDYPPSDYTGGDYGGAQKLTEALCGWDLLGFHPNSRWRSDGQDGSGTKVYDPNVANPVNLRARRGPYLDMTAVSVFKIKDLFGAVSTVEDETYVLCDVFGARSTEEPGGKRVMAGTPILYYKANPASKDHSRSGTAYADRIYNVLDNEELVKLGTLTGKAHSIADTAGSYAKFYEFIQDPRVTSIPWPHNPESYILISAGADGEYGTKDDICNF